MGAARQLVGREVDRYHVLEEIGRGGFGAVYRARHSILETEVALKVLWPERAEDPVHVERFLREARAAASIGSERIIAIQDAGTTPDGLVFLAMELLDGADLAVQLRERGAPSLERAVELTSQVLEGLSAAHRAGIVHRDLKAANVFVTRDGSAKLLDFGISKVLGAVSLTGSGMALGTPQSMAPEQLDGRLEVDARADLYAVGCLLYQLLCGRAPYDGEGYDVLVRRVKGELPTPLRERNASVPEPLAEVAHRALALDRDARWPDALAMRAALHGAMRGVTPLETGGDTLASAAFVSPAVTVAAQATPHTPVSGERIAAPTAGSTSTPAVRTAVLTPASGQVSRQSGPVVAGHASGVRTKRRPGSSVPSQPTLDRPTPSAPPSPFGLAGLGALAVLLALGLGVLGVLAYRYSGRRQPVRVYDVEPTPQRSASPEALAPPPPGSSPAAPAEPVEARPVAAHPPAPLPGDPAAVRFESMRVAGFVDRDALSRALDERRADLARCADGPQERRAPVLMVLNTQVIVVQDPDAPSDHPVVTGCVVRVLEGLRVDDRSPASITLHVVVPPSRSTPASETE